MTLLFLTAGRVRGNLYGRPEASFSAPLSNCPEYEDLGPAEQQALDQVCSGQATLCGIQRGGTILIAQHRPAQVEWRGRRLGYRVYRFGAVEQPRRRFRRGASLFLALGALALGLAGGCVVAGPATTGLVRGNAEELAAPALPPQGVSVMRDPGATDQRAEIQRFREDNERLREEKRRVCEDNERLRAEIHRYLKTNEPARRQLQDAVSHKPTPTTRGGTD